MNQEYAPVPKIDLSGGTRFDSASEIPQYVEWPLVPTCVDLFNKNILTNWTSANPLHEAAELGINYESLSQENKVILQALVPDISSSEPDIFISIPTTDPEKVHQYFFTLASQLKFQNATWETTYTLDHAKKWQVGNTAKEICSKTGYYFSPKDQKFFRSEKAYNRFHGLNQPETI